MRSTILCLAAGVAWAAATAAVAQVPRPLVRPPPYAGLPISGGYGALLAQQRAQDDLARLQDIARQNQLMSLEAQMRTEENLASAPGPQLPATIPVPDVSGSGPYPQIDTGQLASIPDSVLADSNRKVLDAANNRR
jgi:hypothetical protein